MAKIDGLEIRSTVESNYKPGVKTSEFWKSLVVNLIATLIIAYGLWKGNEGIAGFGTILLGFTTGTYNIGRSMEKSAQAKSVGAVVTKLMSDKESS